MGTIKIIIIDIIYLDVIIYIYTYIYTYILILSGEGRFYLPTILIIFNESLMLLSRSKKSSLTCQYLHVVVCLSPDSINSFVHRKN